MLLAATLAPAMGSAAVTIVPWTFADGTIVDSNGDGIPDRWDYSFDGSGEETAGIQLTLDPTTLLRNYESRVFFEFKLNAVTFAPPVLARLTFDLRGSTVFGVNGNVRVYSYPSNLFETTDDFSAGPAVLQGAASVVAYQPATEFSICVSNPVNASLSAGTKRVAFRFQIDPASGAILNHAQVVAIDEFPETKPYLSISVPGDTNNDLIVDLADFSTFYSCLEGPQIATTNPTCRLLDLDCDGDTDVADFAAFQASFTGTP